MVNRRSPSESEARRAFEEHDTEKRRRRRDAFSRPGPVLVGEEAARFDRACTEYRRTGDDRVFAEAGFPELTG